MNSLRCPSCGLLQFATAETCKRCAQPLTSGPYTVPSAYTTPNDASGGYYAPPPSYGAPNTAYGRYTPPGGYTPSPQALNTTMALTAMIMGIVSIPALGLCGIGVITGIISLVLGIVALKKVNKKPLEYGGKGFAIAGICTGAFTMLFFVPFVAAIAIPNLLASRRAANEGAAISTLRTIDSAEERYLQETKTKYGTLEELAPMFQDARIGAGERSGYRYKVVVVPSLRNDEQPRFEATATPIVTNGVGQTGTRAFYIDETGEIHYSRRVTAPATANDPTIDSR